MLSAWCGRSVPAIDEVIELGLLLEEVAGRGFGGLELEREMHAFVAAILLRMAGFDALSIAMPRRSHHTDSLERLNRAFGLVKRNTVVGLGWPTASQIP